MTRIVKNFMLGLAMLGNSCFVASHLEAAELSRGQEAVNSAANQKQFAFILFYRTNDAATGSMHQTLKTTLSQRDDSVIVPVQVSDQREQALINQFDASRLPMPAVAVMAPNGAVTSVFPQRVAPQQLTAAIVSPAQADCLKALQNQKIVLLCVQPDENQFVPKGVQQFQQADLYKNRTTVVNVRGSNPAEAAFLKQLRLPTAQPTPVVAFMAPPGVMLGTYNSDVTLDVLGKSLSAAGKCCDDENCKFHSAGEKNPQRR